MIPFHPSHTETKGRVGRVVVSSSLAMAFLGDKLALLAFNNVPLFSTVLEAATTDTEGKQPASGAVHSVGIEIVSDRSP